MANVWPRRVSAWDSQDHENWFIIIKIEFPHISLIKLGHIFAILLWLNMWQTLILTDWYPIWSIYIIGNQSSFSLISRDPRNNLKSVKKFLHKVHLKSIDYVTGISPKRFEYQARKYVLNWVHQSPHSISSRLNLT